MNFLSVLHYIPPNTNNPDSCKEEQRFYDLKKKMDEVDDKLQQLIKNNHLNNDIDYEKYITEFNFDKYIKEIDELLDDEIVPGSI